jgi:hypothetical protein
MARAEDMPQSTRDAVVVVPSPVFETPGPLSVGC